MLGGDKYKIPWLQPYRSTIDDWDIVNGGTNTEETLVDVFTKSSDERMSMLIEADSCKGKTSLLHQVCLDWGRGASYLQHFHLVVFIDCNHLPDYNDFDKILTKTYRILKQEKMNLQKWEVQKESFLLVIDNLQKLR